MDDFWKTKGNFIGGNLRKIDDMQNLEGRIGQVGIVDNLGKFSGWTGQKIVPMGSGRPAGGLVFRKDLEK